MRAPCSILILVLLAMLPLACSAVPSTTTAALTSKGSKKLVHVVAFWFKAAAPADLADQVTTFYLSRVQGAVPGVEAVWVGPPQPSGRGVVDSSYSLMSVIRFSSSAAEQGWQTHPVHDDLKKLFEPYLEKVIVYDFVE